ncbi:MAG: N-acetyltransferase [Actinomycetales bacterium]|nr:MAG: N-acetyltransferase [Actinomycetales bacterium]
MTHTVDYNAEKQRYEITVDGSLAGLTQAVPTDDPGVLVFPHTKIFDEFEGQGLGGKLVSAALDDVRAQGKKIVAECPYVAHYVEVLGGLLP